MQDNDGERIEIMSISELLNLERKKLVKSKIIEKCYKSPIYYNRWREKIGGKDIKNIDLQELPFIKYDDIAYFYNKKNFSKALLSNIRVWFYSKENERIKWFPYGDDDISNMFLMIDRMIKVVGIKENDIILTIGYSAPAINDVIPYLMAYYQILFKEIRFEIVNISFELFQMDVERFLFAVEKRNPRILITTPYIGLKIYEELSKYSKKILKKFLDNLKIGIFYGEGLIQQRKQIEEKYDIEIYELFNPIEFFNFNIECRLHKGIHLWIDNHIPEIIPIDELRKEKELSNYIPKAMHLCKSPIGMTGEYVITTFNRTLPLVRYRTNNLIRIVDLKPCKYHITHPRIEYLGKVSSHF